MIALKHLSHQYPNAPTPALNDISFTIKRGTCLGLLGPNGAGKTTLISLLSGLSAVQSGSYLFNDHPFSENSVEESQKIAIVPQDFAFYPRLTVEENMQFFASLYRVKDPEVLHNHLDSVGLIGYKKARAQNLSGGLKRRLNFAIALINSPTLIFMDEPTVGVDPQSRQFILDNVTRLTAAGVTVIYTSHYLHEIEQICQKIMILDHGTIRYEGNISSILQKHAAPQLLVVTDRAMAEKDYLYLEGVPAADENGILILENKKPVTEVLNYLEHQGYQIHQVNYGHSTLEAFYLNLLSKEEGVAL